MVRLFRQTAAAMMTEPSSTCTQHRPSFLIKVIMQLVRRKYSQWLELLFYDWKNYILQSVWSNNADIKNWLGSCTDLQDNKTSTVPAVRYSLSVPNMIQKIMVFPSWNTILSDPDTMVCSYKRPCCSTFGGLWDGIYKSTEHFVSRYYINLYRWTLILIVLCELYEASATL